MHTQFQKDLSKLRLSTAQKYFTMLEEGYSPMSYQ